MTDTVLIVDDIESVRRTYQDWLDAARLGVRVFTAKDPESALQVANEHPIDLAVLDWNLESGSNGLQLLEDLVEFQPDLVAVLVTAYAERATPLDALRMGVRDYLDKNQDLTREKFVASVKRQLDRIRPAKRQRAVNQSLASFREAVEKVLPIVRTSAALNDPVSLPDAVKSLVRFLSRATHAADGVLVARHVAADGTDRSFAFGADGTRLPDPAVPFSRSLAATVVSFQEPVVMNDAGPESTAAVELLPFEAGRRSILAVPLPVGGGTSVVLELFDKPGGFTAEDRQLIAAAAEVGAELLRQEIAGRKTHRLLFDAVEAALHATSQVTEAMGAADAGLESPPPPAVMERLREGLDADANAVVDADTTLRLVEAVRGLAVRHGPAAVEHCVRMVADLRKLLDNLTGAV
jgi:ActR/RegA family two-component response regulator